MLLVAGKGPWLLMRGTSVLLTTGECKSLVYPRVEDGDIDYYGKIEMLSRNQPGDLYFKEGDPHPPIQILKLFSESYIVFCDSPL